MGSARVRVRIVDRRHLATVQPFRIMVMVNIRVMIMVMVRSRVALSIGVSINP